MARIWPESWNAQEVSVDMIKYRDANRRARAYRRTCQGLVAELAQVENRERQRLAAFVHDEVSQNLALAQIRLWSLRERLGSDSVGTGEIDRIRELIDQTLENTRSATFDLSPPILYESAIGPALQWLAKRQTERFQLQIEFVDDGLPKPLRMEKKIIVFNTARELLTNVAKHAQASSCSMHVRRVNDQAELTVHDNGIGIQSSARNNARAGFGLRHLRKLLVSREGTLKNVSGVDVGTCCVAIMPLDLARK